jgi:hypothetical protein
MLSSCDIKTCIAYSYRTDFNEDAIYGDVHGVARAIGVDWEGA